MAGPGSLGTLTVDFGADAKALLSAFDAIFRRVTALQTELGRLGRGIATLNQGGAAQGGPNALATQLSKAATQVNRLDASLGKVAKNASTAVTALNQVTGAVTSLGQSVGLAVTNLTSLGGQFAGFTQKQTQAAQATQGTAKAAGQVTAATKQAGAAANTAAGGYANLRASLKGGRTTGDGTFFGNLAADMGRVIQLQARFLIGFKAIQAVMSTISEGVSGFIEFNKRIAEIGAVAGATEPQLRKLSEAALEIGRTTAVPATEAANALVLLSQAGFNASEATDALRATVALSVGGFASMQDSVQLITTTIRAFQLSASDSDRVANVLAATVNQTKSSIQDLNVAFSYIANSADAAGIPLETTAALIGTLADNGIRASTQGTALRQVITQLSAPTKKAAEVFKSLGLNINELNPITNDIVDVLKRLRDAGFGAQQAAEAFGARSSNAIVTLVRNAEGLEGLIGRITDTQAAFDAQAKAQESVAAQAQILANQFQVLAIESGQTLAPALIGLLKLFNELLKGISAVSSVIGALTFGAVTTAVLALARAFGVLNKAMALFAGLGLLRQLTLIAVQIGATSGAVAGLTAAFRLLGGVIQFAFGSTGIGIAVIALTALYYGYLKVTGAAAEFQKQLDKQTETAIDTAKRHQALVDAYDSAKTAADKAKVGTRAYATTQADLKKATLDLALAFPQLGDAIDLTTGKVTIGVKGLRDLIQNELLVQIEALQQKIRELPTGPPGADLFKGTRDQLQAGVDALTEQYGRMGAATEGVRKRIDTATKGMQKDFENNNLDKVRDQVVKAGTDLEAVFSSQLTGEDALRGVTRLTELINGGVRSVDKLREGMTELGPQFEKAFGAKITQEALTFFLAVDSYRDKLNAGLTTTTADLNDLAKDADQAYDRATIKLKRAEAAQKAVEASRGQPAEVIRRRAAEAAAEAEIDEKSYQDAVEFASKLTELKRDAIVNVTNVTKYFRENQIDQLREDLKAENTLTAQQQAQVLELLKIYQTKVATTHAEFARQQTEAKTAEMRTDFTQESEERERQRRERETRQKQEATALARARADANKEELEALGHHVEAVAVKYDEIRKARSQGIDAGGKSAAEERLDESRELLAAAQKEAQFRASEQQRLNNEQVAAIQQQFSAKQGLLDQEEEELRNGHTGIGLAQGLEQIERRRIELKIEELKAVRAILAAQRAAAAAANNASEEDRANAVKSIEAAADLLHGSQEERKIALQRISDAGALLSLTNDQRIRNQEIIAQNDTALAQSDAEIAALERKLGTINKAGEQVIDLGSILKDTFNDAFEGIILGTSKLEDVFKNAGVSLLKSISSGLAQSLIEKLGFDKVFKENFFALGESAGSSIFGGISGGLQSAASAVIDFAKQAAGAVGGIFSTVGGGTTTAPAGGTGTGPAGTAVSGVGTAASAAGTAGSSLAGLVVAVVALVGAVYSITQSIKTQQSQNKSISKIETGNPAAANRIKGFGAAGTAIAAGAGAALGAGYGATAGTLIAPGIGTIIGAVVGAAVGAAVAVAVATAVQASIIKGINSSLKKALKSGATQKQLEADVTEGLQKNPWLIILGGPLNALVSALAGASMAPKIELIFDKLFQDVFRSIGVTVNRQLGKAKEGLKKGGKELLDTYQDISGRVRILAAVLSGAIGAGSENAERIERFTNQILNSAAQQGKAAEKVLAETQRAVRTVFNNNFTKAIAAIQGMFDVHPAKEGIALTSKFAKTLHEVTAAFQKLAGSRVNLQKIAKTLVEGEFVTPGPALRQSRKLVQSAAPELFSGPDFETNYKNFIDKLKQGVHDAFQKGLISAFVTPFIASIMQPVFREFRRFIRKAMKEGSDEGLEEARVRFTARLKKATGKVSVLLEEFKPFLEDIFNILKDFDDEIDKTTTKQSEKLTTRAQALQSIFDSIDRVLMAGNQAAYNMAVTTNRLLTKMFQVAHTIAELTDDGIEIKVSASDPGLLPRLLKIASDQKDFLMKNIAGLSPESVRTILGEIEGSIDDFFQNAIAQIQEKFEPLIKVAIGFRDLAKSVKDLIRSLKLSTPTVIPNRERLGMVTRDVAEELKVFRTSTGEDQLKSGQRLQTLLQEQLDIAKETLDNTGPEFQAVFNSVIETLDEIRKVSTDNGDTLNSLVIQMNAEIAAARQEALDWYDWVKTQQEANYQKEIADAEARLRAIKDLVFGKGKDGSIADLLTAVKGLPDEQLTALSNAIAAIMATPIELLSAFVDAFTAEGVGPNAPAPAPAPGPSGGRLPGEELPSGKTVGPDLRDRAKGVVGKEGQVTAGEAKRAMIEAIEAVYNSTSQESVKDKSGNVATLQHWHQAIAGILKARTVALITPPALGFLDIAKVASYIRIKIKELHEALGPPVVKPYAGILKVFDKIFDNYFAKIPKAQFGLIARRRQLIETAEHNAELNLPLNNQGMEFLASTMSRLFTANAGISNKVALALAQAQQGGRASSSSETVILQVEEGAIQINAANVTPAGGQMLGSHVVDLLKREIKTGTLGVVVKERAAA